MKTSELTGVALDWAVAKCEGHDEEYILAPDQFILIHDDFRYSTNWAQGGPIIEREGIGINAHLDGFEWFARDYWGMNEQAAEKPLVAAMRCYVASKLGDDVEIPEEMMEQA